VELRGDTATGVSYSLVVLIEVENGKRIKNTSGVYYNDEYVRRGNAMSKRFACTCFVPDTQVLSGFGDVSASDRA